jgi:hypothetical protein
MAHHTLTLNYGPDWSFQPDKDVLPVKKGDTISFQLGVAPPDSRFKITTNDPASFSPAEVSDSRTKVTVVKAVNSAFRCQLFDSAGNLLSRKVQDGVHTKPVDT